MTTLPQFKTGDTFELACKVPLAFGQTVTSIDSQIRNSGALVQDLTVTIDAPDATYYKYTLSATAAETALWPIDRDLRCDIQYTIGTKVASTETFIIPTIEGVTA